MIPFFIDTSLKKTVELIRNKNNFDIYLILNYNRFILTGISHKELFNAGYGDNIFSI